MAIREQMKAQYLLTIPKSAHRNLALIRHVFKRPLSELLRGVTVNIAMIAERINNKGDLDEADVARQLADVCALWATGMNVASITLEEPYVEDE